MLERRWRFLQFCIKLDASFNLFDKNKHEVVESIVHFLLKNCKVLLLLLFISFYIWQGRFVWMYLADGWKKD